MMRPCVIFVGADLGTDSCSARGFGFRLIESTPSVSA
jgi:hypothetical protein